MSAEEWRPAYGFPEYEVSSLGRVISHRRCQDPAGRLLAGWLDKKGYRKVFVYDGQGNRAERFVHALVAEAFHGPRPAGADTRHVDGDKTNNAVGNLLWGTRSENEMDKVRHGGHHNARKTHCPANHPYTPENTWLNKSGRSCKTCHRERPTTRAA